MTSIDNFITQLQSPELLGIFVLMLSTFLIGYFSGAFLEKSKKRALINRLKKEVNSLKMSKNVNDIDTIFTEIKPKIIQVVKETQEKEIEIASTESVVEKTRTEFVNYTPKKPALDFESIGFGDKYSPDPLTEIDGIGPYIEEKLNEIGIYNFKQISRLQLKDIRVITSLIDFFPGRIERDDWIGQAKALTLTHS